MEVTLDFHTHSDGDSTQPEYFETDNGSGNVADVAKLFQKLQKSTSALYWSGTDCWLQHWLPWAKFDKCVRPERFETLPGSYFDQVYQAQ